MSQGAHLDCAEFQPPSLCSTVHVWRTGGSSNSSLTLFSIDLRLGELLAIALQHKPVSTRKHAEDRANATHVAPACNVRHVLT